jgi:hypothetical protein
MAEFYRERLAVQEEGFQGIHENVEHKRKKKKLAG